MGKPKVVAAPATTAAPVRNLRRVDSVVGCALSISRLLVIGGLTYRFVTPSSRGWLPASLRPPEASWTTGPTTAPTYAAVTKFVKVAARFSSIDEDIVTLVRVLAALGVGARIGRERTMHGRPAGFRTHALVCLASCLLMLVTVYQTQWMVVVPL